MSEEIIINIEFDADTTSKEDLIRKIIDKGLELQIIKTGSENEVFQSFIERENQGTTGLVEGYAIPHAENKSIRKPALLVYKLKKSIEWESMDGNPINFVFGMLVPSEYKGSTHLKILSEIAKMLMKKEAKLELSSSNSEKDIINTINKYTSIDGI